jgi:hypothetical protein
MKMKVPGAALLLVPSLLAGQASPTLPGDDRLDDSRLMPGVWELAMTLRQGEQEIPMGSTRYELVAAPGERWMYITVTRTELGIATDTSIAMRSSLEPISHRSHAVPRVLALDYAGRSVTGRYAPEEGEARSIARTTSEPTFDAAMLDVLLGALPLSPGYATRLPLYIEESEGLVWFDVEVVAETAVGTEPGWDVKVTTPRHVVHFVIGKRDRRPLAGRIQFPNGAVLEMERK